MAGSLAGQIGLALFGLLVVSAFCMGVIAPLNRSVALTTIGLSTATAFASFVVPVWEELWNSHFMVAARS
ncbi:hypothetical protein ACUXQ2_005658 [Cupriavidus metallidurans]